MIKYLLILSQDVEEDMRKGNNVRCLDGAVKHYDIKRHKKLEIDLRDVKDRDLEDVWAIDETPKVSEVNIVR